MKHYASQPPSHPSRSPQTPSLWTLKDDLFEPLLDGSHDAITIVDEHGTVLAWNRVAETIYGIPKDAIIGQPIQNFFQKGSLMLFHVMQSRLPVYNVYHRPREDRHVIINTLPLIDAGGTLRGAISIERDITDHVHLQEALWGQETFEGTALASSIVERSSLLPLAQSLYELMKHERPVLLIGPAGAGKHLLFTWAVKKLGEEACRNEHVLTLNSLAIHEGLLAVQLFGYDGPPQPSAGLIERTGGGALYLKDIHTWPKQVQAMFGEALSTGRFRRLGSEEEKPVTSCIVATAEPILEHMLSQGEFLDELYYRFSIMHIPPLRERPTDLGTLMRTFFEQAKETYQKKKLALSREAQIALLRYDWPGNIPQLKQTMERLVMDAQEETIDLVHLPEPIQLKTIDAFSSAPFVARHAAFHKQSNDGIPYGHGRL
ncbi:MAG: sigma 54-interacting transcriptional regulator [Candidatus Carbobacillus altaicus]|nr:sigma 54-interacting transcriptional regulator [Candidatus Carbobacillus altaicus]